MTNANPEDLKSPDNVADEIDSLRREIDTVKKLTAKPDKPWYRDGSLLLAATAFLFSLFTYQRQDRHDTEVELRNVLKDLYTLPQQNADAELKFKDNPEEAVISAGLNHQYHVTALQAYALAEHLGRALNAPERLAVADAIGGIDPSRAEKLLVDAAIPEDDIEDFTSKLWVLGFIQMSSGRTELGEAKFQAALDAVKSSDLPLTPQFKKLSYAETEMKWAETYMATGNCGKADDHLQEAQNQLAQLPTVGPVQVAQGELANDRMMRTNCSGSTTGH